MQNLAQDTDTLAAVEALGFTVSSDLGCSSHISGIWTAPAGRLSALAQILDASGYTSRETWKQGMTVFDKIEAGERI